MTMQTPDSEQVPCADCGVRFVLLQEGLCQRCYAKHSAEVRLRQLVASKDSLSLRCWNCNAEANLYGGLCPECRAEQQKLKH